MSLVFPQVDVTGNIGGPGLSSRKPVRIATTASGVLATSFADGQTVDSVVIATNDRILIKNQTSQIQNGVYIVQAGGAPVRAVDYDDGDEVAGSFVYVQEGSTNGGTGWLCTNASGSDVIGVNNITFKLISGDTSGNGTSTDNAIVRWDGTLGTKIQNSAVLIDDSNNMTGLQYLEFNDVAAPANPANGQGRLYKKTGDDGIWWRPDAAGPEVDLTGGGGTSLINEGGGVEIYDSPNSALRTLVGTANGLAITQNALTITIDNALTGANIGTGAGVFSAKSGATLNFRSIVAGTGVSATQNANDVTIANTGVLSLSGGTTGLTPAPATAGVVTLGGTLVVSNGGTGATTLTANGVVFGNGISAVGATAAGTTGQVLIGTTGAAPSWTALSGIAVTSLTGTANQVAVSAATGAITVSTPSTFIAPGTIQDTTGMRYSTSATVTAAGATQGAATGLTASHNVVTSSAASTGVRAPTPPVGMRLVIVNKSANTINVYPDVGGAIDAAGANTAVTLFAGATLTLQAASATQWYSVGPPIVPGAGLTVSYDNGKTTVTAIGGGTSPLTTKGDIWAYTTVDARLPVGANNYILTADSTQAIGLRWAQLTPALLPFSAVTDTLVADQNNYNPAGLSSAVQLRLTASGATRNITGLTISGSASSPNLGELKITNVGSQYNIILRSESASSTAANRFTFDGQDVVIMPGQNCTVWYDWTTARWRGVTMSQDGRFGGQYVTAGVITPAALTVSQNDYNPTGLENAAVIRLSATNIVNLTGISGGYDGRRISLVNIGLLPIKLVNQSVSSLAANRFYTGSSDITLVGNNTATIMYDGPSSFWRITGGTGGATTGAGGLIQTIWTEVTADITTTATDWPYYFSKINAAGSLPTGTITVLTTAATAATPTSPGSPIANVATVANPQSLIIQTTANAAQIVTYTGTTGTTFTGCTGGTGALAVGNFVMNGPIQTTITAGSNGVALPTGTINVVATTGFPASGVLLVTTTNGTQRVQYTGTTGTTFTGCTGGTGTMSTGGLIYNVSVTAQDFLSTNITTSGGALIIIMSANASTASNRTGYFRVIVDGFVRRGGSTQGNGGAPSGSAVVSLKLANVAAGDHVVTCRWVVEGGNFDIKPVTAASDNNASLLVQEVSS